MNKQRRNAIKNVISDMTQVIGLLNDILSDEEESFENMPEGLQQSENGIASEEAQEVLNDAISALEDVVECLSEI